MFEFSVQLLSATFLILRTTERDVIKYVQCRYTVHLSVCMYSADILYIYRSACTVLIYCTWQVVIKIEFFQKILEKKLKSQISCKSVQWQPSCSMWTDGQTDMTKLILACRNFVNAPNITGLN